MTERAGRRAVLIAGPTASGKSALALAKARATGGIIVNTDAMQVYGVLDTLTARPGPEDLAAADHRLYGMVDPSVRFSTGDWQRAVKALIADKPDRTLIFVGGTGLYFEALINGVAEVPEIPEKITARIQAEVDTLTDAERAALIAERDPEIASRLQAPDPQRVVRALAVLEATGQSLASFQDAHQTGLLDDFELECIVLNPDRALLSARIVERFTEAFDNDAVQEVEALFHLDLDPSLPAMKAIGVAQINDYLIGSTDREQAIERTAVAIRQYAKRQRTWFRSHMADWTWVDPLADA